tara:strand:+ start:439 stop:3762 length:3324 start_codon:yes stop_codon:yes gene_type:complete
MANVIKLKRGSGSDPSANDLVVGEVAVRTDTGKLFTKKDNGTIAEISGAGGSDIFINTLSASSGSGGGSATFNGTATRFTLSNPPDVSAQQLLVSVNGVVQKPNAGTSPSTGFAVDGNDIIFAAAPETGASFFIVTYGTIGLGIPADNSVTSGKIADGAIVNADVNASAAIAGSKINPNFGSQDISTTGNLTLYGTNPTISFTDSNEDSDFRLFINAGKFKIQDASNSNADRFTVFTDGHIDIPGNLNCASGLDVTGEITATSHIDLPDDARIKLGTGDDLEIYHDGSNSYLLDGGTGSLLLATNGTKVGIITSGGVAIANFNNNSSCQLFHAGSRKFQTSSSGIDITGNIVVSGTVDGVDIATRDTLFGGLTSSSGVLTNGVTATTQGASDNTTKVATTAFVSTAIGNLINGAPSALDTLNELAAAMNDDAAFSTTVTNSLATKLANIVEDTSPQLGGTLDSNGQNIHLGDNSRVRFGASQDLDIYHNTHSYIENDTGNLYISNHESNSDSIYATVKEGGIFGVFKHGTSEFLIKGTAGGSAELWYDGTLRLETRTNDVKFHGGLVGIDNAQIQVGNSGDLKIYHDGTDSYVDNLITGNLRIRGNSAGAVELHPKGGQYGLRTIPDGATELYHSGNKKLQTVSGGVDITGGGNTSLTINTGNNSGDNSSIFFADSADADVGYINYDHGTNKLQIAVGASLAATIDSNGRVGIGTTSPSRPLHIASDEDLTSFTGTTKGAFAISNSDYANGEFSAMDFTYTGSDNPIARIAAKITSGGTTLTLGTSNNYASGITNEALSIDEFGRVGIGTTNPSYKLDLTVPSGKANLQLKTEGTSANDDVFLRLRTGGNTQDCFIDFGDSDDQDVGFIRYNHSNNFMSFVTNTNERMRVDTLGRLLITTTSQTGVTGGSTEAKSFDANDGCRLLSSRASTGAREHLVFYNPNGDVGDITTSGSNTTFNTSSDYRLKENQVLISDGITRLKTLKPYKFNWKVDTSTIVDGFFAHEVSTAVPEAVTGEKDATENCSNVVLDKNGKFLEKDITEEQWNKGKTEDPATYPSDSTWSASYTKNVYQKIDHSKLVPLLTAALQEAIGKIETLETKVAALEAG